jgi:hypothetical protein
VQTRLRKSIGKSIFHPYPLGGVFYKADNQNVSTFTTSIIPVLLSSGQLFRAIQKEVHNDHGAGSHGQKHQQQHEEKDDPPECCLMRHDVHFYFSSQMNIPPIWI